MEKRFEHVNWTILPAVFLIVLAYLLALLSFICAKLCCKQSAHSIRAQFHESTLASHGGLATSSKTRRLLTLGYLGFRVFYTFLFTTTVALSVILKVEFSATNQLTNAIKSVDFAPTPQSGQYSWLRELHHLENHTLRQLNLDHSRAFNTDLVCAREEQNKFHNLLLQALQQTSDDLLSLWVPTSPDSASIENLFWDYADGLTLNAVWKVVGAGSKLHRERTLKMVNELVRPQLNLLAEFDDNAYLKPAVELWEKRKHSAVEEAPEYPFTRSAAEELKSNNYHSWWTESNSNNRQRKMVFLNHFKSKVDSISAEKQLQLFEDRLNMVEYFGLHQLTHLSLAQLRILNIFKKLSPIAQKHFVANVSRLNLLKSDARHFSTYLRMTTQDDSQTQFDGLIRERSGRHSREGAAANPSGFGTFLTLLAIRLLLLCVDAYLITSRCLHTYQVVKRMWFGEMNPVYFVQRLQYRPAPSEHSDEITDETSSYQVHPKTELVWRKQHTHPARASILGFSGYCQQNDSHFIVFLGVAALVATTVGLITGVDRTVKPDWFLTR
ncbi:hypothetical protein Ciccas_000606 [Cichlidogyrus casuarinus]|uniref:Uncharacterized protein n=1 Tax=Cichlidogyrus casuarinus TaxID=1844966 RepID=A0ABD2QMI9_9PLAT